VTSGYDNDYPLPASVECPFCGGTDTRIEAPFGSVLSVAHDSCHKKRCIFEWIKRADTEVSSQ